MSGNDAVSALARTRICFLAGTLGRGGAERQLFYMLQALTALNVSCRVLSLTRGEAYEERIRGLGVPVVWVGESGSRLRRLLRIISELRSWRPHIIQSAHSFMNLYGFVAGGFLRCLDIGAVRSDFAIEFSKLGYLGRLSMRLPTVLLANSRQAIAEAERVGGVGSRLFLLENGVNAERFCPGSGHASGSTIHALGVGSLRAVKRRDLFLRAVACARESIPELRARLVGDGPLLSELQQLRGELNLVDFVDFSGACDEMVAVYHDAHILVHTSDYEGMPNVILEAMACALPVISTRAGAAPDLVDDGVTGFLTEIGDVEAIAEKMVYLAERPALRREMGRAGREKVLARYDLNDLEDRLVSLYRSLLQQHAPHVLS